MVRTLQECCPEQAPAVKAPPAVMSVWHKGAETKHDENGRLIPWEPHDQGVTRNKTPTAAVTST